MDASLAISAGRFPAFWPSRWSERVFAYEVAPSCFDRRGEAPPSTHLGFSFAPARVAAEARAAAAAAEDIDGVPAEHAAAVVAFSREWERLAMESRRQLRSWAWRRGRPLRSPLLEELEEAATAAKKASSYRRHTANADFGASAGDPDVTIKFWREAWFSRNKAWLPREWKLKNDRRGGYLCWFCSGRRDEASGRCEADSPFCSQACVEDWSIQNGSKTRDFLFERDRGVCQSCRIDCHALYLQMRPLPPAVREQRVGALFDGRLSEARRRSIVRVCNEGSFWQADHVLAVANGGGESGLENSQTLCTPCHKEKTAEEHREGYGGARPKGKKRAPPSGGGKLPCRPCGCAAKGRHRKGCDGTPKEPSWAEAHGVDASIMDLSQRSDSEDGGEEPAQRAEAGVAAAAPTCPACRGRHRAHTCGKGGDM